MNHADGTAVPEAASQADDAPRPEGPPQKMVAAREELTPMLSQYLDLCESHPDAIVMFQVGDFYEAFCEAAEEVARVCEVTLTKREDSTGTYPMAGIPIDNAASYLEALLDAGYRVAVADQVEDASEASGLVDRAVTQVITPGTVVDDELLSGATATYLGAVAGSGDETALATVDVSTGECQVTSGSAYEIGEELDRLAPAELLSAADAPDFELGFETLVSNPDPEAFDVDGASETLSAYVSAPESVVENESEMRAVGGLLDYAEYTQGDDGPLEYVSRVRRYDPERSLQLDATAIRSLELFESRSPSGGRTLVGVLDETACALGRRRLTAWLRRPSVDEREIRRRHDAVGELIDRPLARETVRDHLSEVYDLERLVSRVSRERANARDLRALKTTLDAVPEVKSALSEMETDPLQRLCDSLDELADVRDLIGEAIRPDPPQEITEGGVIREGFDDELDEIRATEREGREWVSNLEEQEQERTGIDSLEVGYNQVHGYYIEVTNPNLDSVPDDYTRRQTLKNSERFYTPELKRREDEILSASEKADALEYEVFTNVRADVAEEVERLQSLADSLATLDVLATFAAVAAANDYVRPEMGTDTVEIEAGRHPVVERTQGEFVPNPADFSDGHVAVITGPNMSGKSTYMRQVALIAILAQAGSFVPARAARLPILDRIFTRVGASDDIAGGQSTFMREMAELTDILHNATEDSLVLLDEVGRGTSTTDGLAIARATTEFVHDEVGATTLFATHYHDLTALSERLPEAFNLHFTVEKTERESGEPDVTFLHRVADGPSSSSYGVEVAKLAGVPSTVVERAREYIREADGADNGQADRAVETAEAAESDSPTATQATTNGQDGRRAGNEDGTETGNKPVEQEGTTSAPKDGTLAAYVDGIEATETDGRVTSDAEDDVLDEIRSLDVAGTTPLEALNTLDRLKQRLDD
ncbi:DNA mismatch repair protein MutS [Halogeometricum borinquense DSM 11551]|uniref:DNA mismatch repair protein MutS n=1 Tax=Halogeometricum borinquense (strain ATCC 700274 / DSM 11551 / JCM 10706 / KCTC 4070 / PR3) TaxID=469382 RepID=E4NM39_HALBP|nr:DNA mismatch repair protein MutS [Halogeometricum borinquense]ADQ66138.1 DNA mismatch repair protein MutS [Halogeometricum borinquense DSM 11551]ELY27367.1 DNA mismatch repair protein MutS [Halogeometricum borinquense DSM 11551]